MTFMNPAIKLGFLATRPKTYESPLQDTDHYILKKLCDQVLPWMIAGRRVNRQWFVYLAIAYDYVSGSMAALAGLGVGAPIVSIASSGQLPPGKTLLDVIRPVLPEGWIIAGVVAIFVWAVVKLVVQKQNVVGRAMLARDCATYMQGLKIELWSALAEAEPLAKIGEIQKKMMDKVQSAVLNHVWPFEDVGPPEETYADQRSKDIVNIRKQYMAKWTAVPNGEGRR